MLFLHPNGFPAGIFDPVARRLTDAFHPIGVDLRGHGGTDVPPNPDDYTYSKMAGDVLAVLDDIGIEQVVALGESLGGGVCTVIDSMRPGVIRRLMLCEAIAFDLEVLRTTGLHGRNLDGENFMAAIARKRRPVWPDRATVRESYGSRPPLDAMAPEALDAYVRWGFVDRPDGRVELACPPDAEATIFELGPDEGGGGAAWKCVGDLLADTIVLAGTHSDLPQEWFRAQAEHAGAPFVAVEGGHFFVQEDTGRAVALVREYLGR